MSELDYVRLESRLVRHYAPHRKMVSPKMVDEVVSAMVAEDSRARGSRPIMRGTAEFVAAQFGFIPLWTWVAQSGFAAPMCMMAYAAGDASSTRIVVGVLSAMCVLVGVPTLQASKLHGVAELEYACVHNAASVMVARLIALGCSSALVVALMVGVTVPVVDASAFDVALWACPPFFLACAGLLMALRKAHPASAATFCVAWVSFCSVALLGLASALPGLYAKTSLVAWVMTAVAALAWLVREVECTLRVAAAGLDAFSPQLART